MATLKLNTSQANSPLGSLVKTGNPGKRVVLKGTDGKAIGPKKPEPTPEEKAAQDEAARRAQEEYEKQMEEYNKQMEEYNRQMEEYNKQMEEIKAAEEAARAAEEAAKAAAEAKAREEAAKAAEEAKAQAAAQPVAELPKTVAKPAVKQNSILKAPAPAKGSSPLAGVKMAGSGKALGGVAAKPTAPAGGVKKAAPKSPLASAMPAAKKASLASTPAPAAKKAAPASKMAATAAAPAAGQDEAAAQDGMPEMSEEELAARDAYLTKLQADASKQSVWHSKGFWIGMLCLLGLAIGCGIYVSNENEKNERAEAQRQNIKKIMHRCVEINKKGVETTADATAKHVDISCSKKDLQLLMKVIVDPYIKNEVGGNLLGMDPVGAGYNAGLLLGLTAAQDRGNRDYIFETLAKKAEAIVEPKLFDWVLQRIGVSDAEGVNANLRTLAEKIAAKPNFPHKNELLASTWKVYGLRVTEEDIPHIVALLKDDKTEGKLIKTLCNCLDNIIMMIDDKEKKAKLGDEIFDSVSEERLKQLGPTLASACSQKALAYYKGKITDPKSMNHNNMLFLAFWGDDSILDYILELKGKAEIANDPKAINQVHNAIGSFFAQNRERSDADAEKLISIICEKPFADTAKLRDIINKIDKDSTLYIGDSDPQLPALKEEAEALKKLQRGKLEIVNTLSGLHELEWVKNLLNKYAQDADGDVSVLAKQGLEKIKENTRKDQQTKEKYQGRSKG